MKSLEAQATKEIYRRYRALPWRQLWREEVAIFDQSSPQDRLARVGLIRAVAVVFSESDASTDADDVRLWLRKCLADPQEKLRRYAMAALPKVGAAQEDEARLIALLQGTNNTREKKFVAEALDKIGSDLTLEATRGLLPRTEQKALASIARGTNPGHLEMHSVSELPDTPTLCLRGRRGLERWVQEEVEGSQRFRVVDAQPGLVRVMPKGPFSLGDLFELRCFGTAGFFLGRGSTNEELAEVVSSQKTQALLGAFTEGAWRYRMEFVGKGHQRGAIREIADRVFSTAPAVLNDPRGALWSVDFREEGKTHSVELRPRFSPDPRTAYRLADIPAASHPPLAACLVRLAGRSADEVIWDPFCGSATELIESAIQGDFCSIIGTDRCSETIAIAKRNFAAAPGGPYSPTLAACDFREYRTIAGLGAGKVSLLITNPPMGMRVPIANLRGLIADLFTVAADVLRPGGRLVFVNPLHLENPHPALVLEARHVVDMSGFDCRVELYVRRP